MAKTSAAAKLDDTQLARVASLADAIKQAPDLRALHSALMAMIASGDLAGHVFARVNLSNLRRFDGAKRPGNEGAISWDSTRALVMGEEGLEYARIVDRIEVVKPVAVKQPKKQEEVPATQEQDARKTDDAPANDGAEPAEKDDSPEVQPATAEELTAALTAVLEGSGWRADKVRISVRENYANVRLETSRKGKNRAREFKWPVELQRGEQRDDMLSELVEGLSEG